jgi:hypothetical protein
MPTDNGDNSAAETGSKQRVFDMRGLWWLPVLVLLGMLAMLLRLLIPVAESGGARDTSRELGPADYGFNLDTCLVEQSSLVSSGLPRDQIHSLSDPAIVNGRDVAAINKRERRLYHRKFIVSGDRVIGVSLNGEQRAYQINILNYHEIINDTLGGVPIVVVYSPLCDSATVFSREIGGELRSFGSSGLLVNSNIVMYDRQTELDQSSLWSQLQLRAIAGPAAEQALTLELLPAVLTHWGDWYARHPGTTLLSGDTGESRDYNSNPYLRYYEMGKLKFPVSPLPSTPGLTLMSRVLAVRNDEGWQVYSFDDIRISTGDASSSQRGSLQFSYIPHSPTLDPPGVVVTDAAGNYIESVSALWFAWYAMYPDTKISSF